MIGPLLALFAAIAAAGAVLLVLLSRRMPEEGLLAWLRSSVAAAGADEPGSNDLAATGGADGAVHVGDLMALGEEGPAYHRPVDLRSVMRGRPH